MINQVDEVDKMNVFKIFDMMLTKKEVKRLFQEKRCCIIITKPGRQKRFG